MLVDCIGLVTTEASEDAREMTEISPTRVSNWMRVRSDGRRDGGLTPRYLAKISRDHHRISTINGER